jgi:chloramphenicol-sensitive protein RarD
MKPRAFACALLCYVVWGVQCLYWNLCPQFSSPFLLTVRIVMAMAITALYLCVRGRGGEILALLRDRSKMRFLLPASVLVCADWGLYIWAVSSGRVLDSSLGYYLNPLVIFLAGVFLFHEKATRGESAAVVLACCGLIAFTVMQGRFPLLSLVFAVIFPCYALMKKFADADPVVSICVETLLLTPFALIYLFVFGRGAGGLASVTASGIPYLIGVGAITALPMMLYTGMVNELPMVLVGVLQYLGTTIGMLVGVLILREAMTLPKFIMFCCIWAGIAATTVDHVRRARQEHRALS